MHAEGNADSQTLICVLVARPRRCSTLSNPAPLTKLNGGLSRLLSSDDDAVSWLITYGMHTRRRSAMTLLVWSSNL